MKSYLIKAVQVVNEGSITTCDVLIKNERFERIDPVISNVNDAIEINGEGLHLLPGLIDDQVHFREPGLTHKAEIYTEAKAAVAGGITSFMEMPNVVPQTLTQELLEAKYQIGANRSLANYSFYMGASNNNLDEILKTDPASVCGLKIFMGSSTGNMLVDDPKTLEDIFCNAPTLIATHCEDEATIKANTQKAIEQYGDNIPFSQHPIIRSEQACYLSSSAAIAFAQKCNARLHILHISSGKETALFDNHTPLKKKKITSEACIHHLWFTDKDYDEKGAMIKWNPAVKTASDRDQIWAALLDNHIDVIATDHAPHTWNEKQGDYLNAPSGGPLVQHALTALLDKYHEGVVSIEKIVEKTSHAVADCFDVKERGYIREGYYADAVLVDLNNPWSVDKQNVLSKCGWSPFEGHTFKSSVLSTFVSGHLAYSRGQFDESILGKRLFFDR
ncbi:MAG: dihydroorotase [Cyclobacteriaceae bacterium]|jgi:dihydroorotase